jgi:hypothetical protein
LQILLNSDQYLNLNNFFSFFTQKKNVAFFEF